MSDTEVEDDMIPDEARPGFVESEFAVANKLSDTREFWIHGNQIVRLSKMFLEEHSSERAHWFDITYVPHFDVTRFNVSIDPRIHKVKLHELLDDLEFEELDYSDMDPVLRVN